MFPIHDYIAFPVTDSLASQRYIRWQYISEIYEDANNPRVTYIAYQAPYQLQTLKIPLPLQDVVTMLENIMFPLKTDFVLFPVTDSIASQKYIRWNTIYEILAGNTDQDVVYIFYTTPSGQTKRMDIPLSMQSVLAILASIP
jgi:hypothetical protein